ncbi:MAG: hypothetical protein A3F40_03650 [Chlamydiae bacterium RIFCSPHIGHO2_12_FULL_27_8]|nr:MAG: hypothetical protein A3F40_03650 [Chlamydiae bacterium RIFCSPHIGHO2_12_FULL_27_8]OGN65394.1 MAG: hypothetical protein A2888_02740 [Chlamydiae bacterium RIFCSPLOWO2_01_FULL_28_7]
MKLKLFLLFIVFQTFVFADDVAAIRRADNIPEEILDKNDDEYFEGYLQALVDMHYYEYKVVVMVKDGNVWLANMPKNAMYADSIVSFLKEVPGVKRVVVVNGVPPEEKEIREKYVNRPSVNGIWFPQTTTLFQPMIANPRQVIYSFGYRGGEKLGGLLSGKEITFSLGDDFPIFRWLDVRGGDLQIGIEAGMWSVFDMNPSPNIGGGTAQFNSDYYLGIPLVYAYNKWAWRFRTYHISSHLGDEFLINNPGFVRVNPSFEAFDVFFSYQAYKNFRVYGGPGWIIHSAQSFPYKHYYIEYGGDVSFWSTKIYYHKLFGTFFFAVYFRNWQLNNMNFDGSYLFGYEWSKIQGVGRKIRLFGEYHNGYAPDGQFQNRRANYWGAKFAYGF